jgi:DNA-directed RNA polymerase subunit N (RpoN/RPB10)
MAEIKFYNLPYHICSCRDEKGEPTLIARNYRKYYNMIKGGKTGVQVLKEMSIYRMCCRKRYLSIPLVPMIDRNRDRYFNDTARDVISEDTRELKPSVEVPDFPILIV